MSRQLAFAAVLVVLVGLYAFDYLTLRDLVAVCALAIFCVAAVRLLIGPP